MEGEYCEYEVYQAYYSAEYSNLSGYAEGISSYIEDWYGYGEYSGYIDYAPYEDCCDDRELEYYYVYLPGHGYVRRYKQSGGDIQAYGGYIGIAPFSVPILPPLPTMPSDFPSANIIDVPVSVTTVLDIQTAVDWIAANGNIANAYRIRLNFPGNNAIGTTTINFNTGHNIIVDSYNGENQIWLHHGTAVGNQRHILIANNVGQNPIGATVEIRDVTLSRNIGTGAGTVGTNTLGGGVEIRIGRLFMNHERANISNARATVGGAIIIAPYVDSIRFWLRAGKIENNVSTGNAGAIWADGVGVPIHKVMTGGYIRNNHAYGSGGAFSICCWIKMWVDGTEIYGNSAISDGGAFHVSGIGDNYLYVLTGEIHSNIANNNGGAIYVDGAGSLSLVGGYIYNNRAVSTSWMNGNGGGIFSQWSVNINVFGGSVTNNHASGDGGGIHLNHVNTWDIVYPLNISGNRARGNGGGLWSSNFGDPIVLCDLVAISNNTAGGNGGGIYHAFTGPPTLILRGGTIGDNGHATTVYTHGGGTFPDITMSPVNINTQNGGGVYVANGSFRIDYGNITGNAALGTGTTEGSGGAVHAGGAGGGVIPTAIIYMYGSGTKNLNNNQARIGGAIGLAGNSSGLNHTNNTGPVNLVGNSATQQGGALVINDRAVANDLNLNEHWIIDGNTAGTSGGGIHMHNSTLTIIGTTITNNEVTGTTLGGGGVFVGDLSTFNIHPESLIACNTAYAGGGVLFYGAGNFAQTAGVFMHGGTIRNNTATGKNPTIHGGGGVALISNSIWGEFEPVRFVMHDGYIINNTSYSSGGGVNVGGVNIGIGNNERFYMYNGTISGNTARQGGGIYVASLHAVTEWVFIPPNPPVQVTVPRAVILTGGEISNNQATTTPTAQYAAREVDPTTGAITPGVYNGSGGGIYVVREAGITIENTDITNNHAYEMGGGIFTEWYQYYVAALTEVDVYTNLTIADTTTFEYNTAGQGDFLPPTNAHAWTNIPGLLQGGTQSIHNHPINNYDINFRREAITTIPFTFHKTTSNVYTASNLVNIADITPFLLEGAYFSLFRFEGAGTPPDFVTYPSANWERIYNAERSTGLLTDPITMGLTPDGIYHLVETLAPVGFQVPFGQWRIIHDDNAPGDFIIIAVGGSAPSFEYLDGYFYVGNVPDFMLPLTGGFANNRMIWVGGLIFMLGFAVWGYWYVDTADRKRPRPPREYSKTDLLMM